VVFLNSQTEQMKRLLAKLSLLVLFSVAQAQQKPIDSLEQLLTKSHSDSEKIALRLQLNDYYLNTSLQKLKENNTIIVNLAQKLNQPQVAAKAYRYLAEAGLRMHQFEQAKSNAEKALHIDDSLKDYRNLILDYNQLGRAYYDFDRPKEAIKIYQKAVNLYEQHPEGDKIGTVYGNIGAAYNRLNRPHESLKYFLKQAEFAEKNNKIRQKSKVNYNIGYTYMQMEQFPKAEKYFLKALADSAQIKVKDYVYVNYHALGMLYSRWNKPEKALEANQKALAYFDRTQNKMYQFDLHNNNAAIYLKLGQKQKALDEAVKAKKIAEQIGFKLGIDAANATIADIYVHFGEYQKAMPILNKMAKDSTIQHHEIKEALYKNLYLVNKYKKDYKTALQYHEKLKKLSDSILKAQRDSKVAEVETRYQTEKKERENLQLKADKAHQQLLLEKENKRNTYLTAGITMALLILGIIIFYYRRSQRQKELIEHLQKDLHHRIKNNLAIIDALIEDIKDEYEDNGIHQKLAELQNRINSINEIHRQLYHNKDITHLNLNNYIDRIGQLVKKSFGNPDITINNLIDQKHKMNVNTSFPIGLIVNEFITNSFKYAFDKGQKGEIKIDLKQEGKNYILSLSDNGKGLPKDLDIDNLDSFGLSIMTLLAKQLKGTFSIEGSQGVKIIIKFPKS